MVHESLSLGVLIHDVVRLSSCIDSLGFLQPRVGLHGVQQGPLFGSSVVATILTFCRRLFKVIFFMAFGRSICKVIRIANIPASLLWNELCPSLSLGLRHILTSLFVLLHPSMIHAAAPLPV